MSCVWNSWMNCRRRINWSVNRWNELRRRKHKVDDVFGALYLTAAKIMQINVYSAPKIYLALAMTWRISGWKLLLPHSTYGFAICVNQNDGVALGDDARLRTIFFLLLSFLAYRCWLNGEICTRQQAGQLCASNSLIDSGKIWCAWKCTCQSNGKLDEDIFVFHRLKMATTQREKEK